MNIGVNLFLTSPQSVSGSFVYIQNILPVLFKENKGNNFYLVGESKTVDYFKSQFSKFNNVYYKAFDYKKDLFVNPIRAAMKIFAKGTRNYEMKNKILASELSNYLKKNNISLYFSPSSAIYPLGIKNIKIVTTILDLQHEYFPENFSSRYLNQRKKDCRLALEQSQAIISISEYTKKTLIEKYPIDSSKIKVVYFAQQEFSEGMENFNFPEEFIFYPAAIWPHKNHKVLIDAMAILKNEFPSLKAICAGTIKNQKLKNELENQALSLGIGNNIIFSGHVFGANLKGMYVKSKALVFPSAFEGFGIPLVEAFSLGVPVIASDNTSISEVVSNAGVLVPTGDASLLADAIKRVLTDDQLKRDLIERGRERAKLFSWQKAAQETLEVFKSVV